MKDYMKKALSERLNLVLKFVEGKTKEYTMSDLQTKEKVKFLKLEDLPCEFELMVNDKTLSAKGVSLYQEVDAFLKECNKSWDNFTGDHLHPVPNNLDFDKEKYNPTLGFYGMKRNKALWQKKSGVARVAYLKHVLTCLN